MTTTLHYTPELLAALAVFAFASSATPGPNNLMLMASGANFGMRRTGPHFAGVVIGSSLLIFCVGAGLGGLFAAYPALRRVLTLAGLAYLVYLAWKLATARGIGAKESPGKPMGFWQAVAFQWVNPKAWAMAVTAVTLLPRQNTLADLCVGCLLFAAVNAPCVASWAGFGLALRRYLDRPRVLKAFNLTMAGLLLASTYPMVMELAGPPAS